jgi:predicted pyridoxine 5'-phosphate oxidase superfamily flavin-nucleotide-binding protein
MAESVLYHEGNRQLQDRFDSRRISDRLEEKLMRKEFSADDKQFIEGLPYFFLATADAEGRPDCSFKGGAPGFVRITGPSEIAFPDYDGNGMFKSLGNIVANADVGLLFIAMHDKPRRLRVNGSASVSDNDPLLAETVGAQLIVRVTARAIFPNCPRYIPTMGAIEPSIYVPLGGQDAPEPAWKGFADFKDCIHPRQPTFKGGAAVARMSEATSGAATSVIPDVARAHPGYDLHAKTWGRISFGAF